MAIVTGTALESNKNFYVSSSSMIVNANRVQIHALAYNLFNWFRRLTLPESMRKDRIDTDSNC